MKSFDPVGFMRQKWSDPKRVKNRPHSCDQSHFFCNIQYEWGTESTNMKSNNRPVNSSLPNVDLPAPNQKHISVSYDSITQQNLDDWIAQSINRSIGSMINPQKKFFLPPNYEEDLKQRYRKTKDKKINEDEIYFSEKVAKRQKGYLINNKKKKISINDLCFDYKKLEPHQEMLGTPIKLRQTKKTQKKEVRRRNAILLNNDVHYSRFLKQFKKEKVSDTSTPAEEIVLPKKQKIFSFNYESMQRSSCYDNVPNSLIENQFNRIKAPDKDLLTTHRALMNTQQQLHEKYRLLMNQKTNDAITQIKDLANGTGKKTDTLIAGFFKKQISLVSKNASLSHPLSGIMQGKERDPKHLQHKVMKLLNDMQVQSQLIDENMARLNIHVNQIFLQHPDSRPQTKWILKAQQKIVDKKNLLAIDCYKQAIILQPQLFIPVFNIAVLLQKQNMLDSARLWFNLAKQFQTDSENVLFGISLVALKQLRYNQSLAGMNQLISKIELSGKQVQSVYYYIRALCNKQLGNQKQTKQDYIRIASQMKPTNLNVLPHFIFSIIYAKQRRIHLQFNSLSYMLFRETLFLILYENKKKVKESDQSLLSTAEKLVGGNFFCRFTLNLVKKLLSIASYQQKQKGDLVFPSKNKTSIIINGIVSLKSHEKDFKKPQMINVLTKGGIVGGGKLDNNISLKPNNWFIAQSKVELITVPREDFQFFWKGQITFEVDFKYNFLKNVELFKNLPDCTLFKLCQLFEKKTFSRGQILFNDCSYRVQMIGKAGRGYGLAKSSQKADVRMIHSGVPIYKSSKTKQRRQRSKIYQIIKKHIFKFNEMKFNRPKYPGLFVVVKGVVQLQDDRGFRCNSMIGQRDFFGENLFIDVEGYQKYGRMVAESEQVDVLLLSLQNMIWLFNQQDKATMIKNCQNRQTVDTIRFLKKRFMECQQIKLSYRFKN